MILKEADDRTQDIATLTALAERPDVPADVQKKIRQEISNIRGGLAGEKETIYQLNFHFGNSQNVMVLHDLRIELNGRVAQIDHLFVNRLLDVYVVESKNYVGGLAANEQGEFVTFWNNVPRAIASPIAQNERHIAVLRDAIQCDLIPAPRRLFMAIPINFMSIISVGNASRISRPEKPFPGLDRIVKADQIRGLYDRDIDAKVNPLNAAKLVSSETIQEFAMAFVKAHRPITVDWAAKFGLAPEPKIEALPPVTTAKEDCCAVCGAMLEAKVVRYCQKNPEKFGGKLLCREHRMCLPKPLFRKTCL